LAGQWKQISDELKPWWGKLTDDDVYWIGGQKDKLTGLLQERYGYTREQAEQEIERRLQEYGDKAAGIVASVSAKAQELGATAAKKANEAAPIVGEKMESLATAIRESAPRQGTLGTATTKVAEHSYDQSGRGVGIGELLSPGKEICTFWRRPLQSILVGFGLGFLLAGGNKTKQY
jgi:uncharacterized protein YjbJ (UPF0337 family)